MATRYNTRSSSGGSICGWRYCQCWNSKRVSSKNRYQTPILQDNCKATTRAPSTLCKFGVLAILYPSKDLQRASDLMEVETEIQDVRLQGYERRNLERDGEINSSGLARDRYSLNAMVLMSCSSSYSMLDLAPYILRSKIQTCLSGHPSSYPHNSELPFLPMIDIPFGLAL